MAPYEKTALQLVLVKKGLDVSQSLSKITRVGWTIPLGGTLKVTNRTHSWRDLRLCCHDLRALFINNDSAAKSGLSGNLGPFKHKENRSVLNIALRMLNTSAPLPGLTDSMLCSELPCSLLNKDGSVTEYTRQGYLHSPGRLATAYIYGQWAHTTRASDLFEMTQKFGEDSGFEGVTNFAFRAGHGFLAALLALAAEMSGDVLPTLNSDRDLVVDIQSARKKLKVLERQLTTKLVKLHAKRPEVMHVRPF